LESELKIVFAASELAGIVKTGGLADAVCALASAMVKEGHNVCVMMPAYREALSHIDSEEVVSGSVVMNNYLNISYSVRKCCLDGVTVYLIEHHDYFDRPGLYAQNGEGYSDNSQRFAFFSKAILKSCQLLDFSPDIIHCHDWQTALLPYYLKTDECCNSFFDKTKSVLTIHNAAYQQHTDSHQLDNLGIAWRYFNSACFEDHNQINLLKGGIAFADRITAVSPSYAEELMTEIGGHGLVDSFRRRYSDFSGILNGCDYRYWNPETDKLIPALFSCDEMHGKAVCKCALQDRFNLPVEDGVPLFGIVSRLAEQKGFSYLIPALQSFLSNDVQLIILGSGDEGIAKNLQLFAELYKDKCRFVNGFDNVLAHWIEAGSDFFLMPSLFEPCGLNQMYSLKYGSLPVVRSVGGLKDTVDSYSELGDQGTGFMFSLPNDHALLLCLNQALDVYKNPQVFKKMQRNAMNRAFTWDNAAAVFCELYRAID